MAALEELDLSSNELSGALPADWSGAGSLILLYLQNNDLTGAHARIACCWPAPRCSLHRQPRLACIWLAPIPKEPG